MQNTKILIHEKWLFENKIAMAQVTQGLKDAQAGRVSELGSFAKYAEEDE